MLLLQQCPELSGRHLHLGYPAVPQCAAALRTRLRPQLTALLITAVHERELAARVYQSSLAAAAQAVLNQISTQACALQSLPIAGPIALVMPAGRASKCQLQVPLVA